MPSSIAIVLWVYIVLLEVGGLIGLLKAGSKISIITSSIFAIPLIITALGITPIIVAYVTLGLLVVVFGIRFAKGKKFMPSGFMGILSAVTLVILFVMR